MLERASLIAFVHEVKEKICFLLTIILERILAVIEEDYLAHKHSSEVRVSFSYYLIELC